MQKSATSAHFEQIVIDIVCEVRFIEFSKFLTKIHISIWKTKKNTKKTLIFFKKLFLVKKVVGHKYQHIY
jgi:hypothetical protein